MADKYIEIISIGNEILSGLTTNTNAAFIARMMAGINIRTGWISTISDQPEEIIHALVQAGKRADIIIATGGLGPTPDDLTKKALATFFKTELVLHQETLNRIRHIFEGRGMIMPDTNKSQAMLPASAKIIPNKFGTAPGLEFRQDDRVYFFLPGVPHEMKSLISDYVLDSVKHIYFPQASQASTLTVANRLSQSGIL